MTNNNTSVKQLVILSGKGGTGKTTLSAALMHLLSESPIKGVFVDADVDAANLALVTGAQIQESHPFSGSQTAVIDEDKCTACGICEEVCRFNAIRSPILDQAKFQVNNLLCDGCAACVHTCPESAIRMVQQQDGEWYHSLTPYGHQFHAELFPAAESSGKLVTTIKQHAKLFAEDHQLSLMIVDGPPGIGCPVISASAGADLALVVTEPGVSGIHDLERIIQTLQHFNIPALVCVNKANIYEKGTKEIRALAEGLGYRVVGEIPFDETVPQAMVHAQPITRYAPHCDSSLAIQLIWKEVKVALFPEGMPND